MKQWMKKLVDQFQVVDSKPTVAAGEVQLNEEQATLLYLIDTLSKHLIEVDKHPLRKVRGILDQFTKEMMSAGAKDEQLLFKIRQFLSTYRVDEYTYVLKTFEDFKSIIWDFADQLSEELKEEEKTDAVLKSSFEQLKEAYESNSIDSLKMSSRAFISSYVDIHAKKDELKSQRIAQFRNNLKLVQKQLVEANHTMRVDHLTQAFNRKSFEEQMRKCSQLFEISQTPVTLISLDIDFFKKINDSYGHDMGDYILIQCARLLKEVFHQESDVVARLGGDEFAVVLANTTLEQAAVGAEELLNHIRKQVFIHKDLEIRFTVSLGVAQLSKGESTEDLVKRADVALYESKQIGRNRFTLSTLSKSNLNVA